MNPEPINDQEQRRILETIKRMVSGKKARETAVLGAAIALGDRLPPYWQINIMCGAIDRLWKGI